MIVWRRERRDLKIMALSIGRIGSESTQAPSLSIGDKHLSRFRSSATPPTCVRVRDRPTLSNARSRLKTPRQRRRESGRPREPNVATMEPAKPNPIEPPPIPAFVQGQFSQFET